MTPPKPATRPAKKATRRTTPKQPASPKAQTFSPDVLQLFGSLLASVNFNVNGENVDQVAALIGKAKRELAAALDAG